MLVGAHHDDNEGNAGGLTMRHRAAGWRVVSVVMTNGRWGRGKFNDENIAIRNAESVEAAKVLDMEPVFMGFHETDFRNTPEACDALVEQIVHYKPDVIATHPPHDYHIDHMGTSQCVLEATHLCGWAVAEAGGHSPRLYYYDAVYVPFEPDVYVDISDYIEAKSKSQACHESQFPPKGSDNTTIIDLATTRGRYRGIESGVKYAEAFRFVRQLGRTRMAEVLQ